jgi:alpha-N-arabinofuranosidase
MIQSKPSRRVLACAVCLASALWAGLVQLPAQTPLAVYTDSLVNGFQDWGWAPHNFANLSPVNSGSYSISVTISDTTYQGLQIVRSPFDSSPYSGVTFWLNGGASGGQQLQISGLAQIGSTQNVWQTSFPLSALPVNTWQKFTVPLSALGLANRSNATGIVIQDRIGAVQPTFYLDDIQFDTPAAPALVQVSLNATQSVRTVDARHFAVNLAVWDGNFDPPNHTTTIALLQEMGCLTARLPGGSLSDEYHFTSNTSWTNTWQWQTSFPKFMRVVTNVGAQVFVTVNYGSGSPQEAAAWVAYANASASLYGTTNDFALGADASGVNWRTVGYWSRLRSLTTASNPDHQYDFLAIGRSAPFGIKNWEIGNECYGTWERDTNTLPNNAYTYAVRATNYFALMKAVDPTINVGVVAVPDESAYNNGYTDHPAINPRTGQTNYGWTPVLLTSLKSLGVTPNFLVHHVYPEWTDANNPAASSDNDATLLQSTGNWATDAATLRQHISDYFGAGGTNIELVVTENNSDSGAQGKQSTSLVNGLYYADSLGQLLKTEFNSYVWWDLRNGTDTSGFFGTNLYGWRTYGDLGLINGLNTRHPTFYAAKLMQWLARPGEKILNVATDYPWLSAYAARRANGAVALLVLNKSIVTNLIAQITLTGFTPGATAPIRSFGIPNDEAARTNGPVAAQDITTNSIASASTNFTYSFPPYSMTLFTLAPVAPRLLALPPSGGGQFIFQLQGQQDVRYVIQSSSNLTAWVSVSTNTLTGPSLNVTNAVAPGSPVKFWRAVWSP